MKPRRLSARKIKAAKDFCRQRDGDRCMLSKRLGDRGCNGVHEADYRRKHKSGFLLHHIDNNPSHNPADGSNWELACRACNTAANPRGRSRALISLRDKEKSGRLRVRERIGNSLREVRRRDSFESIYDSENPTWRLINDFKRKKKKFDRWLFKCVSENKHWDLEDAVYAGAEVSGASDQTVRKWVRRAISSKGKYETDVIDGVTSLVFKGHAKNKNIDTIGPDMLPGGTEE